MQGHLGPLVLKSLELTNQSKLLAGNGSIYNLLLLLARDQHHFALALAVMPARGIHDFLVTCSQIRFLEAS